MENEIVDYINDRHILVAVDDSENAERAVLYVADFLGGVSGFRATILNVIPEPPTDYFKTNDEREAWIDESKSKAAQLLDRHRQFLIQSGFPEDKVDTVVDISHCPSVADCILDKQRKLKCCTVIIGRRGISKKEEFLFGSTSSRVMHSGKNCAVWVIE
jgi:nucleotide-binding universal stress UspA family protein